jgi:hypothetical protein
MQPDKERATALWNPRKFHEGPTPKQNLFRRMFSGNGSLLYPASTFAY